jgi:hypothetical protein
MGQMINAYKIFVGKPEGKTPKPRCRWEDNVRMDLQGKGMRRFGLDASGSR